MTSVLDEFTFDMMYNKFKRHRLTPNQRERLKQLLDTQESRG